MSHTPTTYFYLVTGDVRAKETFKTVHTYSLFHSSNFPGGARRFSSAGNERQVIRATCRGKNWTESVKKRTRMMVEEERGGELGVE